MLKLYNTLSRKKEIFKRYYVEKSAVSWETHWYQLRDNELLKLRGNLLKKLIKFGIKKAGNLNRLCKAINMSYPSFLYVLRGQCRLISVKKLRKLAFYLGIDYNYFDDKISEIRKGRVISIKNPKFPFNLATVESATILGNITSDGCLHVDKKSRGVIRTSYSAATREELNKFINNICKIFGKVYFQRQRSRNSIYLRIGSSIIGENLYKIGAPLGDKSELNPCIPWLIKEGPEELKIGYLRAVFDDEGTPAGGRFPYISLSRYVHINKYLNNKQRKILKQLNYYLKERRFPTGHKIKSIDIKKAIRLLKNRFITKILLKTHPRLLIDESELLLSLGIENWIRNSTLNLTERNTYSINSELRICRRESVVKFYKKIGFGLTYKKEKLKKLLSNSNWI